MAPKVTLGSNSSSSSNRDLLDKLLTQKSRRLSWPQKKSNSLRKRRFQQLLASYQVSTKDRVINQFLDLQAMKLFYRRLANHLKQSNSSSK
jgi:hypothetical protein